jgi:putative glycosyltransferase (TIGR04372 family)
MVIQKIRNLIRKKIEAHKRDRIFYLRIVVHLTKYILSYKYRKNRCLIEPQTDFFYQYRDKLNYISRLLTIYGKHLEKKKIFISVNNEWNFSIGHVCGEINTATRMQKVTKKYYNSQIWFLTSRKDILKDSKEIFISNNFKILFGGFKRILLTFVAIKYPTIAIDASIGDEDYIFGNKTLTPQVPLYDKPKKRAQLLSQSENFYPFKEKLNFYEVEKKNLFKQLKLFGDYIVIQIKTNSGNGTFEVADPSLYIDTIKYFQKKNYKVVLAGREKCPNEFLENNVVNYSESKYATSLNDFILVGNSKLVIGSASGFCMLPECLDIPVLVINSHHNIQYFGRRTIVLPTLLSRKSAKFNAKIQHYYLCKFGADCGKNIFEDLFILHMPTSKEILEAAKELESMVHENIPPYSEIQKKIRDNRNCPLLADGLSRISNYYLLSHGYFFE